MILFLSAHLYDGLHWRIFKYWNTPCNAGIKHTYLIRWCFLWVLGLSLWVFYLLSSFTCLWKKLLSNSSFIESLYSLGIRMFVASYNYVHSNSIHTIQKLETTYMSFIWRMDKEYVVHLYNAIVSSYVKQRHHEMCRQMDGTWEYYPVWEHPKPYNMSLLITGH